MEFIAKQLAKRLDDEILSVTELGDGHINDTFLVEASNGKYVAQRLSKNMDIDKLEYNYDLYSEVFEGFGWLYPKMIKDEDLELLTKSVLIFMAMVSFSEQHYTTFRWFCKDGSCNYEKPIV